jgi:hypothetical protein
VKERRLFPAIYRGTVVDNVDPEERGRVKVKVPSVLGEETDSWAMPAEPYGGPNVGFFAIPPIGAEVWVQFEGGIHTLPVWTGCFWTTKEDVPVTPASPDIKVFRTEGIFLAHNNYQGDQTVKCGDAIVKKGLTLYVTTPILQSEQGFLRIFCGVDGMIEISNNDEEIIRMNKQQIQIIKENQSIITLTKPDITLQTDPLKVQMLSQSNTIQIKNNGSTITLNTGGIESTHGAGDINMSDSSIDIKFGGSDANLAAAGIGLTIGAASIQMSPASVNVNEGALEVI